LQLLSLATAINELNATCKQARQTNIFLADRVVEEQLAAYESLSHEGNQSILINNRNSLRWKIEIEKQKCFIHVLPDEILFFTKLSLMCQTNKHETPSEENIY
jgi:hypothetical protein